MSLVSKKSSKCKIVRKFSSKAESLVRVKRTLHEWPHTVCPQKNEQRLKEEERRLWGQAMTRKLKRDSAGCGNRRALLGAQHRCTWELSPGSQLWGTFSFRKTARGSSVIQMKPIKFRAAGSTMSLESTQCMSQASPGAARPGEGPLSCHFLPLGHVPQKTAWPCASAP